MDIRDSDYNEYFFWSIKISAKFFADKGHRIWGTKSFLIFEVYSIL